jgi:uncharacterized protein (TIGR03067 family)
MKTFLASMFLAFVAFPILADDDDPVAAEWEKFKGEWHAVAVEMQGRMVDESEVPEITIKITELDKLVATTPDGEVEAGMEIDLEQNPHQFDVRHTDGVFADQNEYGIYRWDGDKLIMCIGSPEGNAIDRPSRFSTQGTQDVMITFEKEESN